MAPFRPFRHNKRQQIALRPSRQIFFHYAIFFFRESLWSNGVGAHLEAQESRQPFSWDIQMGENYNSIVMFEFDWIVLEDGYAEKGLIRWNIKIHEWIVDLDRVGDWIEPPYVDISFNDPSFSFFFFFILWKESRVFDTEKIYADVRIYARIEVSFECHYVSLKRASGFKDTFNLHLIFE